ncbi:putative triacylglycerol lipase [Medicago truncatula]|uniref:Alpha/beta fold hydrolase n=1 Tax=Medicago truncatula TaxID=3880 RepID=G7KDL3_MEDTR|nr:putative 2-succinyl-6-hydroxy-2,4-cyclohexadiene-1-carboxylate synthase [Medicago truncatula]AES94964.1 alpha/beta fold hydrolase [Medicago truncatula]RHN54200.1 putative triacylglycerol lipase [Medicago truncatula]
MVNTVNVIWTLVSWVVKMAGLKLHTVEIEPGTVMRFWVPSNTISKSKLKPKPISKPTKPVVVLLHGFCGDGLATWQYQINPLAKKYAVYVPDLIFFGGSTTDKSDRSLAFQAECLAVGLKKLGVEKCVVVGFSYGGMVAFKMAEMYSELVEAVVVSGAVLAVKESMISKAVEDAGFSSCSEMLMPSSVEGVKTLLSVGFYKNIPFPNRLIKDFLKVMFSNRKERSELLDALVISYKDINIPKFSQRIHLLWAEKDKLFTPEVAQNMKEKLGNKSTLQEIKKAGHLAHIERPCVYNRCLKQFLASVMLDEKKRSNSYYA